MKNREIGKVSFGLILIVILLFAISCIAIYSAQNTGQYSADFLSKQIIWYVIGVGILMSVMFFDLDQLKRLTWYAYGFGIILLIALILAPESIAPVINGAKSWFKLPGLGSFQPSEIVKPLLILTLSLVIVKHNEKYVDRTYQTDLFLLVKMGVLTAIPLGLIMMQPDLGTSLVLIAVLFGLIFVSGISWKIITPIYTVSATLVVGLIYAAVKLPHLLNEYLGIEKYQLGRIYSWLYPHEYADFEAYHLTKSLLAIGSGQLLGKGFSESEVYIPEAQTDFIFSVIGEEYGFVGSSLVLTVFFMLIYQIIKIALEIRDPFGSYICIGVIVMFTFHVFQNVGMAIGVLPITGIPLPFISYGGSSLMGSMLALGLVFNVRANIRYYMFSD